MRLEVEHKFVGPRASIFALENSPKPQSFISGDGNGLVCHWSLDDLEQAVALASFDAQIFSLRLCWDDILAIGTMRGQLFFYDFSNKSLLKTAHQLKGAVFDIQIWGEELLIATESGELVYLDRELQLKKRVLRSRKSLRCIEVVNDDLAYVGASDHKIYALNKSGTERPALDLHQNSVFALATFESQLWSAGRDAQIGISELHTGARIDLIAAHMYTVNDLVLIPKSEFVVSAGRDKAIKVWSARERKLQQVVHPDKGVGHLHSVNCLLPFSEGKFLISGSDDRSMILWSVNA